MSGARPVRRLREALARLLARDVGRRPLTYAEWYERNAPRARDRDEQRRRAAALQWQPAFDVVIVPRRGDALALAETRSSLSAQTYGRFAVHESADASAEEITRAAARGNGDLITFLDAGDRFSPHALFAMAATGAREAGLIYGDEDVLRAGVHQHPVFKPGWSPDALLSHDYVGGPAAVRRELFDRASGLRAMSGAERHDLFLRLLPYLTRVEHVPQVLLHRDSERADPVQAQRRAVAEHVTLTLGAHYDVAESGEPVLLYRPPLPPRVSIVIPTRDRADLLRACVDSLDRHGCAARMELTVVDNSSVEPATREYFAALARRSATAILAYPGPFNWSAVNNFAARHASGDYLLFLNNDVEALAPGWLDALVAFASRPEIGVVGGLLLYPNGTVQHAGVVLGLTGYAGHVFAGRRPDELTPFGRADTIRNCTAVTGACMLMRRRLFDELGGFDERFILCGSDVEICLRARARGLRNVMTPHARLVHRESKTRGTDIPRSDFRYSFAAYEPYLRAGDPYYNANLSLQDPAVVLRDGPEDMLAFARSFL